MKFSRLTVTAMIALAFSINSRATFASDKTEVVDAVNRYLSNLEKDKIQTAVAMCDPEVSILDEFRERYLNHILSASADCGKLGA